MSQKREIKILQGHTPVTNFLNMREFRDNRLWKLKNGVMTTRYNGEDITAEQFDRLHPVPKPVSFLLHPDNKDKTRSYLL